MKIKILYPSDYYDIKTVEPDYENEFKTVSNMWSQHVARERCGDIRR